MPKLNKAESARRNGAKSHGPITPEGRATPASNALKHGITAKTLILQNENPIDLLNMLNSYVDYLQPANQIEIDLVTDMVAARWRLRRIWRYETAQLDIEMDAQGPDLEKRFTKHDEDMRGSLAFTALSDRSGFATAIRNQIHLSREYRRTLIEFRKIARRTQDVVDSTGAVYQKMTPHVENRPLSDSKP